MAKSAMGKLSEADDLNKTASKIRKRDPESARSLDELARKKRRSAIKQMNRRVGRKSRKSREVIG